MTILLVIEMLDPGRRDGVGGGVGREEKGGGGGLDKSTKRRGQHFGGELPRERCLHQENGGKYRAGYRHRLVDGGFHSCRTHEGCSDPHNSLASIIGMARVIPQPTVDKGTRFSVSMLPTLWRNRKRAKDSNIQFARTV
jgi:hypothetical protein